MIVNQELIKMVSANTLFKGVSKEFLKSFIRPKNYYGVKEGTIIYSKGDESTNLYLIVEGEVKIKFCDKNKVEHRFITDFFGETEILKKEDRVSHAVANNDCILYKISADELAGLKNLNKSLANNLLHKTESHPAGFDQIDDSEREQENENIIDLNSNELPIENDSVQHFSEDELEKKLEQPEDFENKKEE